MSHSEPDPPLPVLSDFEAVEAAPSPPERWWTRYFSYLFFCGATSVIASGVALLEITRLLSRQAYLRDPEGYNRVVIRGTMGFGLLALVASLILCVWAELKFRRDPSDGSLALPGNMRSAHRQERRNRR